MNIYFNYLIFKMKKFMMVFGLALVVGVGVFSLTDSFAEFDFKASVIEDMGCGCAECGAECQCGEGIDCGHADCGCAAMVAGGVDAAASCGMDPSSCSGKASCADGSACAKAAGGCAAKKTPGAACGCGK